MEHNTESLLDAWIRSVENNSEQDRWAVGRVKQLITDANVNRNEKSGGGHASVVDAWMLCLRLIRDVRSRRGLLAVAAGPLSLLLDTCFDECIALVKSEVKCNPRLEYVLTQVWVTEEEHVIQLFNLGNRAANLSFSDEDESLQSKEIERIISNWLRFHRESGDQKASLYWAVTALEELPLVDPHKCWRIVQTLVDSCDSPSEFGELGVVLGRLLELNYPYFIESIKQQLPISQGLVHTLKEAFLDGLSPANQIEVQKLGEMYS